ncbi:MAG: YlzJ-like family protein [Bacillota bacterium]|jgi:hypothetical protein|nr:YlzJ-like family protein [Bacillota bacterium]HHU29547.1 hypothetical protein [Bacillota bacterium]
MLWTVMPLEAVMEGSENFRPNYREFNYGNSILLVEETGESMAKIIRVISTDPLCYLDPLLQPGSIISLTK